MRWKISIEKIILYGSVMVGYFFWYQIRIAQVSFAMIFGLCIYMFLKRNMQLSKRLYPYLFLTLFMTVISIKNKDPIRVMELPGLAVIAIHLYSSKVSPQEIKKGMIRLLKITSILFALPLSSYQAQWAPSYCGIFSNPDTLGSLESLAFCLIFVQSCEYYLDEKRIPKSNLGIMLLNVIFSLLSQSRISILGIVLTVFGLLIYAALYFRRNRIEGAGWKIHKIKKITLIMIIAVFCAVGFLFFAGKLPILYSKVANISTVETRFDLYRDHLSGVKLFGTNRAFVQSGTDSTIIYLAVWFGPIVPILFYILVINSFFNLLNIQIRGKVGFDGFYAIISMGIFFLQSITTDMLYTAAMFLTIIFYGVAMAEKKMNRIPMLYGKDERIKVWFV